MFTREMDVDMGMEFMSSLPANLLGKLAEFQTTPLLPHFPNYTDFKKIELYTFLNKMHPERDYEENKIKFLKG